MKINDSFRRIALLCLLVALSHGTFSYAQDDFSDEELFFEEDPGMGDEELFIEEGEGSAGDEWADFVEDEESGESSSEEKGFSDLREEDLDAVFDDSSNGDELSFDDFEEAQAEQGEFADETFDDDFELDPLDEGEQQVLEEPLQPVPPMEDPQMAPVEPVVEAPPEPQPPAEEPPIVEPSYEATAPSFDGPDLAYEAYLYNIYLNYHRDQMSESQWQSLLQGRQSEIYRIQPGDTLWGISLTLFGDGNYWPKIWAVNNEITNPHLIQPGHEIRFLLGTESDAPAFTVTEGSEEPEVQLAQEQEAMEEEESGGAMIDELSGIEIPPPTIESRSVIRNFPPSLPAWQMNGSVGEYDDAGISYGRRKIADLHNRFYLQGYVNNGPPKGIGKVLETESGGLVATDFMHIYIEVDDPSVRVGDEFSVVRDRGAVVRANSNIKQDNLGNYVRVEGRIKITDKVESTKDVPVFRAVVKKSINPVRVGSTLVREPMPIIDMSSRGQESEVVAQIVGGVHDNRRQIFGPQSVTFLNRGEQDGLQKGQIMAIRANRTLRDADSIILENSRPIGWLKVVRTTPTFATAIVLQASEDILAGDFTGKGAYDWGRYAVEESQKGLQEVVNDTGVEGDQWSEDWAEGDEFQVDEAPGEGSVSDDWELDESEFE